MIGRLQNAIRVLMTAAILVAGAVPATAQTIEKVTNAVPAASDTTSTFGRIPLGTTGKGDALRSYAPHVILDGGLYRMWYVGLDALGPHRIYHATSTNGIDWVKTTNAVPTATSNSGGTPSTGGRLFLGGAGRGDSGSIQGCSVIKDGSTYKMWYMGNDGSYWRIFHATSADGLTWAKYDNTTPANSDTTGANGQIPRGATAGRGDDLHTFWPSVMKDNGTYKMWYVGQDSVTLKARIFHATSPDGLTWTKLTNSIPTPSDNTGTLGRIPLGVLSGRGDTNGVNLPCVIKQGMAYRMWYSGHNGTLYSGVYHATSPDGLTWTKKNNVTPTVSNTNSIDGRIALGSAGRGDDANAFFTTVVDEGATLRFWYSGTGVTTSRIYSATWLKDYPTIADVGASNLTASTATLVANVVSTGQAPATVSVYWGPSDAGTNLAGWANTNVFAGDAVEGLLSTNLTGLAANSAYFYRFQATNQYGVFMTDPVGVFSTDALTIQATDASATEGGDTGAFSVSRSAAATNVALVVQYDIAGTASNGGDYTALSGSVTLAAGATSATITVTALMDFTVEGVETVSVTLVSGTYAVGAPSNAVVTINNTPITALVATGGIVTNIGVYRIHTFTNSAAASNLVVTGAGYAEVLLVAGGGGGGETIGGGGGAGGLIYTNALPLLPGTNAITIGIGGAGGSGGGWIAGSSGGSSTFGGLLATGGGGGGGWFSDPGLSGGSGGGGCETGAGGSFIAGQGKGGGAAGGRGGGGGGAGVTGTTGTGTQSGAGGAGLAYDISGVLTTYAGGGGGGAGNSAAAGAGGSGGGGAGGAINSVGTAGALSTGGGGGGGGYNGTGFAGGWGGSGILIVKYDTGIPAISNLVATNVTATSANLNGSLTTNGMSAAAVRVYWGLSDGGAVAANWAFTNSATFPAPQSPGPLTLNVSGLASDSVYYFRYYATNSFGEAWAGPSQTFITGEVTVQATDPNASEVGTDTGTFTISRPASTTNGALTVNYSLSGSAANGLDYALASGSVTLAAGATNATVTLTPLTDLLVEGNESAILTLSAGAYSIGAASNATVTIGDASDVSLWARHMQITFTGYNRSETLTNFPALVVFSNAPGFAYAQFLSGANADLRFTGGAPTTELKYEIENWDTNGVSAVWVQVPALVGTNTAINAYWGRAGQSVPAYTTNGSTWETAFQGVWHMGQTNAQDSTANTNHGASFGNTNATGMIGGAQGFSTNYVQIPHKAGLTMGAPATPRSFSALINSGPGGGGYILTKARPNASVNIDYTFSHSGTGVSCSRWYDASGSGNSANGTMSSGSLTNRQWHHVAFVNEGASLHRFYADGVLLNSDTTTWTLDDSNTQPVELGRYKNFTYGTNHYAGLLDEVRIETVARSSNWIWACWMNQVSNALFATTVDDVPAIQNVTPSGVVVGAATLNGYLSSTGSAPTFVTVYWGTTDGGTNAGNWQNTNAFVGTQGVGSFGTNVVLNVARYYYTYMASNSYGAYWATPSLSFIPASVSVQATDAYAKYGNPGVFTFSRPSELTNGALTVNYTLSGSATNGVDYGLLATSVVMADGASNATVTITPLLDLEASNEDVTLSLAPGNYGIGSPSNGTVTIAHWLDFTQTVVNVFSGTGNWNTPANWSLTRIPEDGDIIRIAGAVTLTNSTPMLSSLTMNSGSITFSNWNTLLAAGSVSITNGTVTHAVNTDTNGVDGWQPDSRIQIQTTNLTLVAPGTINADAKGYKGGLQTYSGTTAGYGPGRGLGGDSGSSHGGLGTGSTAGIYDSTNAPTEPGSGGGDNDAPVPAGTGGGAVRIVSTEQVTINGVISANGQSVDNGGGGAGGSIWITCRTIAATSGVVRVNGGDLVGFPAFGGMGGGGRMSIVYDPAAQTNMPAVTLKTSSNRGVSSTGGSASLGTINLTGPATLPGTLDANWNGHYYGVTNWATPSLTVSNALVTFKEPGFALNVAGNIRLAGTTFDLLPASFTCGGNLVLTNTANSALLYIRNTAYLAGSTNYGVMVGVTGTVVVTSNAWIYPISMNTNGASCYWQVGGLTIAAGGGISADGLGYATGSGSGYGPGYGPQYGGGSHGGQGGKFAGGGVYDSSNAPAKPGSGGGGGQPTSSGGAGGGFIGMEIAGTAVIDGLITANGNGGGVSGGGGAGGGIYLSVDTFDVAFGTIRAGGGGAAATASPGGGGGGRIAMYSRIDNFGGTVTAPGGTSAGGFPGGTGTVVRALSVGFLNLTITWDPARHGIASPLDYGVNGMTIGQWVTNSVTDPADETNGVHYTCLGWTLKTDAGTPLASGPASTQAVFQVNTNLILTWFWTNGYYLTASANVNGALQTPVAGWYTNDTPVTLTAVPNGGYDFLMWSGTGVPAGMHTNNPLTVTMTRERTIQANFASQTVTARSWTGTGNWFSSTNWSPAGVPSRRDPVTIASGTANIIDPATFDAANVTINGQLRAEVGAVLNVATNVLVSGAAAQLRLSNNVFQCGGDLLLTNSAAMVVYSGPANAALAVYGPFGGEALTNYGAYVSVGGRLVLATNSWVYPYSPLQVKGAPFFRAGSLTIATNAGFNADGRGYQAGVDLTTVIYGPTGYGPGRGGNTGALYAGAGYGGLGGGAAAPYGQVYGSSNAPVEQGSGGAGGWSGAVGGAGGGAIQLEIDDYLALDGVLTANGGTASPSSYMAAGGSGGAIYVRCARLLGSGTVRAKGGDGCVWPGDYGGRPGGGGRIAIWLASPGTGVGGVTVQVTPGHVANSAPTSGGTGTFFRGNSNGPGTILKFW